MALRFRALFVVAAMAPLALVVGCSSGQPVAGPSLGPEAGAGLGSPLNPGGGPVPSSPGSATIKLSESGSSLLYTMFQTWAGDYHQQYQNITITTAKTSSGKGIKAVSAGKANIGASDAFLSSGNLVQHPDLLNIPLVISAQQVNYYLPKLPFSTHLRLDSTVLAEMYAGKITSWSDSRIQALNPNVRLPSTPVYPLHRGEPTGSGDTFLFTSYLSTNSSWNGAIGYGTTVAWPSVANARAETGNDGMVMACATIPGCVAYVGISDLGKATAAGLGEAQLRNAAGQYYLPSKASMSAAVASFVSATPANGTISMVNGPALQGYPIVNYEYAIVSAEQPNQAVARVIKAFLHWVITTGNSSQVLGSTPFQPLPAPIAKLADAQIGEIR